MELGVARQFGFLAYVRLELYAPTLEKGTTEQVLLGSSSSASLAVRSDALFEATPKLLRSKPTGWTYKSVKLRKDGRAEIDSASAQMSPWRIKFALLYIERTGDVFSLSATKP